MKRAVLIVAVAALCVAGSAVAQDRSGLIGSGTRTEDGGQMMGSGNVAGQTLGSGGFTTSAQDQYLGNGGRTEDGRQVLGSGMRAEDSGQMVGSGGFTMSAQDQFMGSGGRAEDGGGTIGSGTRAEDGGGTIGGGTRSEDSGAGETSEDGGYLIGGGRGGYFGSGLSVRQHRLLDGSSALIVSSDGGMYFILIEE